MKIPVIDIYRACKQMIDDGYGYIWGTSGKLWTQADQDKAEREMTVKYGQKWVGHHVVDCSGAIVKIWRDHGLSIPHGSSSMVRQGYIINCGNTPYPGWAALVDPDPSTPDNEHIGIVLEDGETIFEAKGTIAGCVYSKVTDKRWTKFGQFKDVDYEGVKPMDTPYQAVVNTQSGSLNVRSGPGTEYPKVGKLEKGTIVTVKANCDGWDFIEYKGLQGYCSSMYLKPVEEPEPKPEPVEVTITIPKNKAIQWKETLLDILSYLPGGED